MPALQSRHRRPSVSVRASIAIVGRRNRLGAAAEQSARKLGGLRSGARDQDALAEERAAVEPAQLLAQRRNGADDDDGGCADAGARDVVRRSNRAGPRRCADSGAFHPARRRPASAARGHCASRRLRSRAGSRWPSRARACDADRQASPNQALRRASPDLRVRLATVNAAACSRCVTGIPA